jgi:hypothetical protein
VRVPVRKRLRLAVVIGCVILALIAAGLFALYRLSQHVPEFYRQAMEVDPAEQKAAHYAMEQRAFQLESQWNKGGPWVARFTAEQINGWLAVDAAREHPLFLLPPTIRDPRVAIEPDRMILACRYEQGRTTSVLTLAVEPCLLEAEPNSLAVRIRNFRAGRLPIPLTEITTPLSEAAKRQTDDLRLQWRQEGGDPVAVISLLDKKGRRIRIETVELRDGEICVAGTIQR